MRAARFLPLLGVLPLVGCLLSGQFVVAINLDDPIDIPSPAALIPIPVDLTTESVYKDHKENISNIVDAALLGQIENVGTTTIRNRAMTDSRTPITTATPSMPAANTPQSANGWRASNGAATRNNTAPVTKSFTAAPYSIIPKAGPL